MISRVIAIDRRSRLFWLGCALIAVGWALPFAQDTKYTTHQVWGSLAVVAYGLAALAALTLPRRWVPASVTSISLVGAVLAPLVVLTTTQHAQSEVGVVERSAQLLMRSGAVYVPDPQQRLDYNPYLPGMTVFGLPHQLLSHEPTRGALGTAVTILGDARIWFALVFLGCLLASWHLLRLRSRPGERRFGPLVPLALVAAPIGAIPLCVSGVELPIIGLSCLTLACASRGWGVSTGLVAGLTCALKWTAWPLLPVAALLVLMRRGAWRAASCLGVAVAGTALSILPFALHGWQAMVNQVARFPLGLARFATPAASPLPGHALAGLGTPGRIAGLVLLALGCGAVAVWTLRRPPRTAAQAWDRLAAGLTAAFLFAPASRFGYFALPAMVWLLPHLATGRLQFTLPRWLPGRAGLHVELTFAPAAGQPTSTRG